MDIRQTDNGANSPWGQRTVQKQAERQVQIQSYIPGNLQT